MLFMDYVFHLLPDGSIMMDQELKPKSIDVKDGDRFIARVNDKGTVYFMKVPEPKARVPLQVVA